LVILCDGVRNTFLLPPSICGFMGDFLQALCPKPGLHPHIFAQLVLDSREDIEVSRQLLRLRLDAPVPKLGEITFRSRDPALIRKFYSEQGFPAELGGP
jgi:hypothetical protein